MKQKSWTPLGRDTNPHHVDLINLKKFKDYFFCWPFGLFVALNAKKKKIETIDQRILKI